MMDFSVIVPVYNAEKYIVRCIESILSQTHRDFELILVDDGSKDHSASICDFFAINDDRISFIKQENAGVASARNAGINLAKGKYIVFVDADDSLLPDYLEYLYSIDEEYDYVVTRLIDVFVTGDGEETKREYAMPNMCGSGLADLPEHYFINGLIHSCCGKRYKQSIIKQNELEFPNYRVSEDSFFNLKYLATSGKWFIIGEHSGYQYYHRSKAGNATSTFVITDINTYNKFHETMLAYGIKASVVKKTMYAQYFAVCFRCYKELLIDPRKKADFEYVVRSKKVRSTLLFTRRNKVEKIEGFLLATKQFKLLTIMLHYLNSSY